MYGSGYKDRTCLDAGSKPTADTSQLNHNNKIVPVALFATLVRTRPNRYKMVSPVGIAPTSQRLKAASLLIELRTRIRPRFGSFPAVDARPRGI